MTKGPICLFNSPRLNFKISRVEEPTFIQLSNTESSQHLISIILSPQEFVPNLTNNFSKQTSQSSQSRLQRLFQIIETNHSSPTSLRIIAFRNASIQFDTSIYMVCFSDQTHFLTISHRILIHDHRHLLHIIWHLYLHGPFPWPNTFSANVLSSSSLLSVWSCSLHKRSAL